MAVYQRFETFNDYPRTRTSDEWFQSAVDGEKIDEQSAEGKHTSPAGASEEKH